MHQVIDVTVSVEKLVEMRKWLAGLPIVAVTFGGISVTPASVVQEKVLAVVDNFIADARKAAK